MNVYASFEVCIWFITIQTLIKDSNMNTLLGFLILSAFAFSSAFGGKCEPLFSQSSPSNWNDVRQGSLQFPIPESTTQWTVDITFDNPVHTLNPWDGANGKCTTSKNKCTFTNADWNAHKNAGNLKLGFETKFNPSNTPPKFKKIIFKLLSMIEHFYSVAGYCILCSINFSFFQNWISWWCFNAFNFQFKKCQ